MFQNITLTDNERTYAIVALHEIMYRWSQWHVAPRSTIYQRQYDKLPFFVQNVVEEHFPLPTNEEETPDAHRLYVLENLRRTLLGNNQLYGSHQSIDEGFFQMM